MALKLLSDAIPRVAGKTFSRKYIALGRIVTHWKEIIGPEMASRTQPLKIHYRKPKDKNQKAVATLDIAASSAEAATLQYQKGLILERINHIFGDGWVTDIRFIHQPAAELTLAAKETKPLTGEQKNYLSHMLEGVEDPEIRQKLENLGSSLLQDKHR